MPDTEEFQARIRRATELLETVVGDPSLLEVMPEDERIRFVNAAADVFCPDVAERRRQVKARQRRLRAKPVFTTPNVFPPEDFIVDDIVDDDDDRLLQDPEHCYVCKKQFSIVHHFYDQLCPSCAAFNYGKRTESADLHGRVALLTGGRVKI